MTKSCVLPSTSVFMQEFSTHVSRLQASTRVSLPGVVTAVRERDTESRNDSKRVFSLVGVGGFWCRCFVVGKHADNFYFRNGAEVVLLFCTGCRPLDASSGQSNVERCHHLRAYKVDL